MATLIEKVTKELNEAHRYSKRLKKYRVPEGSSLYPDLTAITEKFHAVVNQGSTGLSNYNRRGK